MGLAVPTATENMCINRMAHNCVYRAHMYVHHTLPVNHSALKHVFHMTRMAHGSHDTMLRRALSQRIRYAMPCA